MKLNTQDAILDIYRSAIRQELANRMIHKHEWQRFERIAQETERRMADEKVAFQNDYHQRLATAKQVILREVHGNLLTVPKRENIKALPDEKALTEKADHRIRKNHEKRLSCIRRDEIDQYQTLKKAVNARDTNQGRAQTAFEKAHSQEQTRSGPSR